MTHAFFVVGRQVGIPCVREQALVLVIVQLAPDVVAVLELVPVHPVNCVPLATAFPRLVVQFVRSVLSAAKMLIRLPAVGAALAVIVVP